MSVNLPPMDKSFPLQEASFFFHFSDDGLPCHDAMREDSPPIGRPK